MKIQVTRVTDDSELDRVMDLCSKAFSGYYDNLRHWRLMLKTDPGYRPGQNFVVYADGKPVSNVRITNRLVRVGTAVTKLGFVGDVCSDADYRGRHYATACLEEAIRFMRENGYTLSLLGTGPGTFDFYRRLGWEVALARYSLKFDPRKCPEPGPGWQAVAYEPGLLDVVSRMYDAENASRTFSVARDRDYWKGQLAFSLAVPAQGPFGFLKEDPAGFIILMDAHGQPRAYGRSKTEGDRLVILEVAAQSHAAALALLSHLCRRSSEARAVAIDCPPDTAVAAVVIRELDGEAAVTRSGRMLRIIDLPGLLRDIEAALQQRLARASPAPGAVWLETDLAGSAGVEWDGRQVAVLEQRAANAAHIRLPQSKLCALITGYRSVREVLEQAGLIGSVTADALALLDALFPVTCAHMWEMDTA